MKDVLGQTTASAEQVDEAVALYQEARLRALIDNMLTQQATIIAFGNAFKLLMILAVVSMPFLLVIGKSGLRRASKPAEAAAVD